MRRTSTVAAPPAGTSLGLQAIGHEAGTSEDDHQSLRLWLRLLSCTNQLQTELRRRLHARFAMTLSRFDYLAQLHRHPEGLRMSALSGNLMVTGGSVTGLTNELVKEGLVSREVDPHDRRSFTLRLTVEGRRSFERIAAVHEAWVIELFAGLPEAERRQLAALLGRLRMAAAATQAPTAAGAVARAPRRHRPSA